MADDRDKIDQENIDPGTVSDTEPAESSEDDDFDYQKEIEEIEAQERELALRRAQKQKELEERRRAREAQEQNGRNGSRRSRREESRRQKEAAERRKEREWLGEPPETTRRAASSGKKKKKKSHKGLAAVIVILIIAVAGVGGYAFKTQADRRTISDFQAKVSSFQTDKLDGADLGSDQSYFDNFMKQCQDAIDSGNVSEVRSLNSQWSEMEQRFNDDQTGKTSMDAFVKTVNDTLSKYQTTDDTKDQYDSFMEKVKEAQNNNDYSQIDSLQSELDSLVTTLKAADISQAQNLKNSISDISLDTNYVTDDQQKELDSYSSQVDQAESEEDYATEISTLNKWLTSVQEISSSISSQKKEASAKASSEAAAAQQAQAASESRAAAAAESTAQSIAESRTQASSGAGSSSGSSSSGSSSAVTSYSQLTADYVIPDSSSRYLTNDDLKGLSALQLKVARNEIYARHGRRFDDSDLQAYFNSKSWYSGTVSPNNFSDTVFNAYEKANLITIKNYEGI